MKCRLVLDDEVRDLIRNLPPALKQRLREALDQILSNPLAGKALVEDLIGLRSFPMGRMRIIYKIADSLLVIVAIGPRKDIYEKVVLELKQAKEDA